MGFRLSLYVLPKEKYVEVKKIADDEEFWDTVDDLEQMKYDYCTDAMLDVQDQMLRLTDTKLSCECDIVLGAMDKEHFKIFMESILKYAKRQWEYKKEANIAFWWWDKPSNDKWSLTESTDWVGAYFDAMYMLKMFDWDNNVIMLQIS